MGDRASAAPRRSQQERSDGTQRKLLEATLRCLGERGFARTTTTEIVRAAGVSQGALFKHYPTKAELLSKAVELLFEDLVAEYEQAFAALPKGREGAAAAFSLLWSVFSGPRLTVAFELYTVARTDPALKACLEPVVQRHRRTLIERAARHFPRAAAQPEFAAAIDLVMCAMEGMAVERHGAGDVTGPALALLERTWTNALLRWEFAGKRTWTR